METPGRAVGQPGGAGAYSPAAAPVALRGIARLWWLWLVFGIAWIAIAVVILQFDQASITTVGVLIGIMFAGRQHSSS